MSNPFPSPGNRPLDQLKVAELRDELRRRGLSLKGVKKELFERLDEAVRKEQAGVLGDRDVHGGHSSELPPYHSTAETTEDNDGMSYLNDVESIQDTSLIVNNASPYVGAPDATPVFMESQKDTEKQNSAPSVLEESKEPEEIKDDAAMEESKDDASRAAVSALSDSGNIGDEKVLPQLDNIANTGSSVLEADNQVLENSVIPGNQGGGLHPGDQAVRADTTLPGPNGQDSVMPSSLVQGGDSDTMVVATVLDSVKSTVIVEPADGAVSIPLGDETLASESAVSAQVFSGADVASMVISNEGDKDVPSASVSDDILNAADASVPAADIIVNANDSPMQDSEVFERTVLTSVSVVPCVQGSEKEPDGAALKIGNSGNAIEELVEKDTKDSGLKEGVESVEATMAAPELPMLEAGEESRLPESEGMHDVTVHELAPDSAVHEEPQDIEMSEAPEIMAGRLEASELKPSVASLETPELPIEIKSENVDNVGVVDTGNLKEPSRGGAAHERGLNIKSEPREEESRVSRRAAPVENVKVEQQEGTREDPPRTGRNFDRSHPRDYESDRSRRNNSVRAFDDRGRVEGRSGRHFKEEGRKETVFKPDEGSDVHTGQKRKDDDRDAKQQEPAKRVRRWNSGNQPAGEAAKPLTSGTVKEMVSPDMKKEEFAVEPQKLTPKLSGPVRPTPPVAKLGSEANGEKRAAPPSTRAPSSSLKVERFVRPFTLKAVKDLLAEFGQCEDFWMDQIKTHCYVTFSKVDEAIAARNGLYDRQWPPSFGNRLVADFVDSSEVKMRSDGSFEKMNAPPSATTPRGFPNQPPPLGAQPSFHGHSNALASAPPLRERQHMLVPVKDPEPPVPTLDDLFRKTKAKPHIYYLPLTNEQVAEKLAVAAKNKEQQPSRGRPLGRV